jgi:AcrR family transcriptional regulator
MTGQKRPYRMKRRAELEQATRRRVIESLVELHGTVGPARTSISLIARRAGVRRSTVYRHFPDERALLTACSSHWLAAHPLPNVKPWAAIADPSMRLRAALNELYAYYSQNERMLTNLLRDEVTMPILRRLLGGYRSYLAHARDTLVRAVDGTGAARRHVRAAIGHALAFHTWRSLVREQGVDETQAVDLMCRLIAAASGKLPQEPLARPPHRANEQRALPLRPA